MTPVALTNRSLVGVSAFRDVDTALTSQDRGPSVAFPQTGAGLAPAPEGLNLACCRNLGAPTVSGVRVAPDTGCSRGPLVINEAA